MSSNADDEQNESISVANAGRRSAFDNVGAGGMLERTCGRRDTGESQTGKSLPI